MTDYFDEYERPVCPICKDETFGRPCETSYCAGYEAGRLAAVRADVADFVGWCERDIAKHVALAAESRAREAEEAKRGREYEETRFLHESIMIRADRRIADHSGKAADCQAWLARARAVLG